MTSFRSFRPGLPSSIGPRVRVRSRAGLASLASSVSAVAAVMAMLAPSGVRAQTSLGSFTYQGRLNDAGAPATGLYDLRFAIHDVAGGGSPLGTLTRSGVPVTNGLFAVNLEFAGVNIFDGANRWLELAVKTNGAAGSGVTLAPRQQVTAAPYAITAGRVAGTVPVGQVTGSLPDGQLSPNVALRAGGNAFTGAQSVSSGALSFTDVNSGLRFPEVGGPSAPMLTLFSGGTANADRMVLGHSPDYPRWGLQYRDSLDQFVFLGAGSPAMTVSLGDRIVGIGTATPQAPLHIYSSLNPTALRLQSAGAPGFGRIEFYSDPQGSANEWRPAYIESTDAGGFNGGLRFVVNGAGTRFGEVETMRIQNGRVGIGTDLPGGKLESVSFEFAPAVQGVVYTTHSAVVGENRSTGGTGVTGRSASGGIAVYGDNPGGWAGSFNGSLSYSGVQNQLNVADNFVATVRAADFFLGHSSRRGTPGRALVDMGDALHLNFASDWANTFIGGANVSVCTLTIRGGCDLAEPFKMSEQEIPKGAVVVIDEANPGHLKMSTEACDRRVAGIVSGANGVKTGVTLTQEGVFENGQNVALSGRVYVQADATSGEIRPGDLLTTSDTPGHAMRVADYSRAHGAILGKAMTGLKSGKGFVLVLVSLQ